MNNEEPALNSRYKQLQEASGKQNRSKDAWPIIILAVMGVLVCICVGIVITFGRRYLQSKTVIVFEPDYSRVANVNPADLEETARILTERCDQMGCSSVSFTVSGENQIIGKVPVFMTVELDESLVARITTVGLLEFVDFGNTPFVAGTLIVTDYEQTDSVQADEKVWHTVMTNEHIASVSVSQDNFGKYLISFTLTEQGVEIFSDHTTANVGKYLGIVLDKIVVSSPIINEPILAGEGQISGSFTKEAASDLAAYLQIAPLTVPLVVVEESAK